MALKLIPLFAHIITILIQALIISFLDQSISLLDSNPQLSNPTSTLALD